MKPNLKINITGDFVLMLKDKPVMKFSLDNYTFEVLDELHLPYQLKGRTGICKGSSINCNNREILESFNYITLFLANRVLVIDRENAKKILNILGFPQAQGNDTKRDIALFCRGVSLQDNYWVCLTDEDLKWKDVNLRLNSLNRAISQVALHGDLSNITLQGKIHTPELTTNGTYAKAWKRETDGIYLYKRGNKGSRESIIEVEISNILDKLNVPHIKYTAASSKGVYCCKCRCMTDEKKSMLTALDFFQYCKINNKNPLQEMYKYEPTLIYQMFIVDYLFSNSDRHIQNWGFYYACDTMNIIGCHPLFDHNNAFDKSLMFDKDGGYNQVYYNKTMLEVAKYSLTKINFSVKGVCLTDFKSLNHYRSFRFKAKNLGLL